MSPSHLRHPGRLARRLLPAVAAFALAAPALAQPTPAQLDRIAALVEAGKTDEAKIRVETLLEVFPEDATLLQVRTLLASATPAPRLDTPAAATPPAPAVVAAPITAAEPPPAPLPAPAEDKTSVAYWIKQAEETSLRFGDTVNDHAFRIARLQLIPAYQGRADESLRRLGALRAEGKLNATLHSNFVKGVGEVLNEQGRHQEALELMPKVEMHWHRRTLGRLIAEAAGPAGKPDIARAALKAAYEAQELQVAQEGAAAQTPESRHGHFCELASTAAHARLPGEAALYLQQASAQVRRMDASTQCYAWSFIGQIYALAGLLDDAEKSLRAMTGGSNVTPLAAFAGWKNSVTTRIEQNDPAGARRLLTAGRDALKKAGRKFKGFPTQAIAENLPDSLLQPSPLAGHIAAKRPHEAWSAYKTQNLNLRFNSDSFHAILDLFIETQDLDSAREMLTNPKLGLYVPPNNQEDVRETADTLAHARAKLAAAYLLQASPEAFAAYLASLPRAPLLDYNVAFECANALARKPSN